ncbi:hypothetical protein KR074_007800, partial [Drosophila pseudoananassae]
YSPCPLDNEKFVLLPNKPVYTVGRQATDLIIKEDLSVSRTHVKFHLPGENDASLRIEDLASRYGTFIFAGSTNEAKKVAPKQLTPIPVGIRVRFGGTTSIWNVTQLKIVTTTSSLGQAEVQELVALLRPLGGAVTSAWTEGCSHLTMNGASVTVKLLHAMLENKPIVTVAYWRDMLKAAQRIHVKERWPQPEDYQPTNLDVKWRPERTRLFAGKTFIFMHRKHIDMYGSVVQKAGAACKDLNNGVRKTFLTKKNVIVVQYVPSTQSQSTESVNFVIDTLEQAGLRIIQEYEIGMALINCSIAEFCNPLHKLSNDSMPTTESMTSSLAFNSSVLAPNTERSERQSIPAFTSELTVPESDVYEMEESEAQSVRKVMAKRGHASISKSSDEEVEKNVKRARSSIPEEPKIRNKNPIMIASSDEEESVKPPPPVQKREVAKKNNPVYVDSSDEEDSPAAGKEKEIEKKKEVTRSPATRSSSRLNVDNKATNITKTLPGKTAAVLERKNIINEPPKNPTTKPKSSTVLTIASDDDDEELFKFSKPSEEPTESSNLSKPVSRSKNPTSKPKSSTILTVASDDDDEELFQFSTPSEEPTKSRNQAKPVARSNTSSRISVANFLEKSQPQEPRPSSTQSQLQSQTQPRKRLRLEPLNESDSDDGENLFNFAGSKKKKKNHEEEDKNDSNDGFFNFNSNSEVDQDFVPTEPFPSKLENKSMSKYVVPQRKEVPKKVDVSGWLSGSRLHQTIKSEANASLDGEENLEVKLEKSIKEDPDEENDNKANLKWEMSMKDSIQVKMCSLNISSRSQDEVDGPLETFESKYAYHKNFKKFVKTSNLHPRAQIAPLKRLQLADGIVTCI